MVILRDQDGTIARLTALRTCSTAALLEPSRKAAVSVKGFPSFPSLFREPDI
jgi:hypothetical protein